MKKFIFGLMVFLVPGLSNADVITPGVGLLMPTTGVVDLSGRSWADKYNENFRIIASTITQSSQNNASIAQSTTILSVRLDAVAVDTTTLKTRIDNLDISTASISARDVSGTTTTRLNNLDSSTAALTTRLGNLNTSTATLTTRITNIDFSTSIIRSNLNNIVSTNIAPNTIIAADVAISVFLSSDASGVTPGIYTNTNLTVDPNGRITSASNGTAGSGGTGQSPFKAVIGTTNVRGATNVGTSSTPFITAFSSAAGVNIFGSTCIAPGTFFVQSGSYTIADTTVPYGAELVCESSAVFRNDTTSGLNKTMFTVYGTIRGCTFDVLEQNAPHVALLDFKTGSRFYNNKGRFTLNVQDSTPHQALAIHNSSNVWFYDNDISSVGVNGAAQVAYLFDVIDSSNVFIDRNNFVSGLLGGNYLVHFEGGQSVHFTNNLGYANGGIWRIEGAAGHTNGLINISSNKFQVDSAGQNVNGIALMDSATNGNISTGVVIMSNKFELIGNKNFTRFMTFQASNGSFFNPVVADNFMISAQAIAVSFFGVTNIEVNNAIFMNNYVCGISASGSPFIADSGRTTVYTTNDNFFCGAEQ